jgi:steroid delta-isomerase-like uncharacterized protein
MATKSELISEQYLGGEMRRLLDTHDLAAARHDAEAVAATFAEDGEYENFSLGLRFEGRDAVQLHYAGSYQMTPDMRINYLSELAGHNVVARLSIVSGTVREQFVGVPAEGPVEFPSVSVFRFGDELLSHVGVYYDLDVLCQQLQISSDEVRVNLEGLGRALLGNSSSAESDRWRRLFRVG